MTAAVQHFLNAFDSLSEADKHEVAVEILRRWLPDGDVPDAALDELAAELFRSYDAEEDAHAASEPRRGLVG
jgi:hypothetical protein